MDYSHFRFGGKPKKRLLFGKIGEFSEIFEQTSISLSKSKNIKRFLFNTMQRRAGPARSGLNACNSGVAQAFEGGPWAAHAPRIV